MFNPELILKVLKTAKSVGAWVSLDLASFNVVKESHAQLQHIIADYVDILIANEDEAMAYTGHIDEALAIQAMAANVQIAVLKVGERGSLIARGGKILAIRPKTGAPIIDTTGAGDLWAAGFLYGLVNGYTLEKCGELGSACGYEVCRVVGTNIPDAGWKRIKKLIK